MEDKVKSLDKFISEDCGGDLEKARNLFKSVVQDILLSSEFDIENTVRNSAIKKHITKGEFSQVKQMLAEDINIVMEKTSIQLLKLLIAIILFLPLRYLICVMVFLIMY